jgi:hypothetical protein
MKKSIILLAVLLVPLLLMPALMTSQQPAKTMNVGAARSDHGLNYMQCGHIVQPCAPGSGGGGGGVI